MSLKGRASQLLTLTALVLTSVVANAGAPKIESVPGEYVVRLKPNMLMSMNKQTLSNALGAYVAETIPSQNIVVVKRPVF